MSRSEREPSSSPQNPPEPRGLLYVLLAAFAFFSGWSLSRSRTQDEDGSEGGSPQDNTREETGRRQIKPLVIPQRASVPIYAHQTDTHKDDTPRCKTIREWSI